MNIFIDEVIRKLIKIRQDGYFYCDIDFLPEDEVDGDILPPSLTFSAIDIGGEMGVDYFGDSDTDVCEVPQDELSEYAHCNHEPSPNRKTIKEITIND